MWIFKTGDCLIEVTTWAGLTVKTNDNKPAQISQHKIKTNHLEHHLCLLPLLEDVWGNLKYTIIYRVESGIKHHNSNPYTTIYIVGSGIKHHNSNLYTTIYIVGSGIKHHNSNLYTTIYIVGNVIKPTPFTIIYNS
jgi:hypothetical protein